MTAVLNHGMVGSAGGYSIANSLRLRAGASAYLSRTPGSAGNRKSWTWSGWVKRGAIGTQQYLFTASLDGSNFTRVQFTAGGALQFIDYLGAATVDVVTTQLFRDPSAHFHLLIFIETSAVSASDRLQIYVNGQRVTSFSSATWFALNADCGGVNRTIQHQIGALTGGVSFDGLLSDVHFIDGQALTPSSFGEQNSDGVWVPKRYTGTYGNNGFKLDFSNGSSTTTLGYDSSGNGNNWTLNNISLTAGVTYDWLTDTPTNNYCTLNPLDKSNASPTNGNLSLAGTGATSAKSTVAVPSVPIYIEATAATSSSAGVGMAFGLFTQSLALGSMYITGVANSWGIYSDSTGVIGKSGTNVSTGIITANETYQLAIDLANGRAWLGRNNVWYDSSGGATGNPSTGANPTFTSLPLDLMVGLWADNSKSWSINFGQRPFAYTPPTGFKALCTANMPAVAITAGANHFRAITDTGANIKTSAQAIFTDELAWVKDRANSNNHQLMDSVRGVNAVLQSNTTAAETTYSAPSGSSVGWVWKANGAGVSNTDGSITSTVSANPTAGFSIVTYTGTGANATVGHGLGKAPSLVIVKQRDAITDWHVYHTSLAATDFIRLNLINAKGTNTGVWNSTAPTSTVFSLGGYTEVDASTKTYVAYCFAEIAGFSKFGSYTGNASTDGPFVYCGFRPRWVLVKASSASESWIVVDAARNTYNVVGGALQPNLSDAEATYSLSGGFDFTANGFKLKTTGGGNTNAYTYIFAAFAEFPQGGANVAPAPAR